MEAGSEACATATSDQAYVWVLSDDHRNAGKMPALPGDKIFCVHILSTYGKFFYGWVTLYSGRAASP